MNAVDRDSVGQAPAWAYGARILSALSSDMPNLKRMRDEFGATAVLLYCCPETTNAWCPAGTWKEVEAFIKEAHRAGLKVVCYYDTTLAEESFHSGHEAWTQRNAEGLEQSYQPAHVKPRRHAYCFNSPWSGRVQEIASRYVRTGADGVFLDNPCYYEFVGKSCFCAFCQERFRKESGKELKLAGDQERVEFLKRSIQGHVLRVYDAIRLAAGAGSAPVLTCNSSSSLPTNCLATLGSCENVLFREMFPGAPEQGASLEKERAEFSGKPLWVILTEESGARRWVADLDLAAREFDGILEEIFSIGASPMVWSTIPSQDPSRPGFTEHSIFGHPRLAGAVKRHFLKPEHE